MTQKDMVTGMYKILVTGNGEIPLPEKVRNNEYEIKRIIKQPDIIGKWVIRVIGILMVIGQGLLAYKIFLK